MIKWSGSSIFLESWYNKTELQQHAQKHIRALSRGQYDSKAAFYLTEALAQAGQLDQETEDQMILATRELLKEKRRSSDCRVITVG